MNLGKSIRLCRIQKDISQVELSNAIGASGSYMSLMENGKRNPTLSTLEDIAKAIDVPVFLILFLAQEPHELEGISPELIEKLTYTAWKLSGDKNG